MKMSMYASKASNRVKCQVDYTKSESKIGRKQISFEK